jgi:hypothetical protein
MEGLQHETWRFYTFKRVNVLYMHDQIIKLYISILSHVDLYIDGHGFTTCRDRSLPQGF